MTVRRLFYCIMGGLPLLSGCRTAEEVRDPEYAHVSYDQYQAWHAADPVVEAVAPIAADLEGPHAVEDYIRYALEQNPAIQAARKRVEALAYRVPVASSLQDPMVGMTVFPSPVQTAAGAQTFSLSGSQKIPWRGKLSTRSELAESDTTIARAQLAAAELETIEKVKRAYYELYFVQQTTAVTEAEKELLQEIRAVAIARYKNLQTSQQDVLRADLEISNVENELIVLRQRLTSGQARLAGVLHVSPQTNLLAVDELPAEQAPRDLNWLQQQAVAARPELHARLAALERDRKAVELSKLDYMPDVTLGAQWINVGNYGISPVANGRNAVLLTAGVNMPIYRRRLEAAQRSTEAMAVSTAREYDAMRDGTLEEVTDLFAQAQSQEDLLRLFQGDILPAARQTLEVSQQAYSSGEVDFLQLLDNWRELLRYEISYRRLEASLRQSLAELERVIGGENTTIGGAEPAPADEPIPAPKPR